MIEPLLRELAPVVLSSLVRQHGQFDACEDAVQEALLAAAQQWPTEGEPDNPRAWLQTVASRRLVDQFRSESSRREREDSVIAREVETEAVDSDDTLTLLFLCCHPALSPSSQLALTLRAVGGLSTAEIASAFLTPEATMAQRISRAKQAIRAAGARFELPPAEERAGRLAVVLHVLYLIFNEGYTASSGASLQRADLTTEAIRVARMLYAAIPAEAEVVGLLALMLLTDARRAARERPDGGLVALADQDRSLWDREQIDEGRTLIARVLGTGPVGQYQVQAAIAALHDEASSDADTDWKQILALYTVLERVAPSPVVTLNRAVALARVDGPLAALALIGTIESDPRMANTHRLDAVRAHLLELSGDSTGAIQSYLKAAVATSNLAERRYLLEKAQSVGRQGSSPAVPSDLPSPPRK